MASTAIVLHELETDQPSAREFRILQDERAHAEAQADPTRYASTEDTVVLEVDPSEAATADDLSSSWVSNEQPVTVSLTLDADAEGSSPVRLESLPGRSLAWRSAWFGRTIYGGTQFVESSTRHYDFRGNGHVTPGAVRLFLEWLDDGTAALERVGSGAELVAALQLASYWEVPRLLSDVEKLLVSSIDEINALALLELADETGARILYSAATAVAVDKLEVIESAEGGRQWRVTPAATLDFLRERRRLRDAARQLGLRDDALPDAREFVSMLREATAQQRERCEEAAEWAARAEEQLSRKLAQRVARGEISQLAAEAIFVRDTCKPRRSLQEQREHVEAEAARLQAGVTSSIIDGWLAGKAKSHLSSDGNG